jgi:acetylornithine deacetylase
MKGGVACMVLAAEVLAELGVRLAGELVVNTVTEEESTGAGGLVSARTLRANAAIVPELSALAVWVACRGSLLPTITVEDRAGHAGIDPRHPDRGGAVNAIEKAAYLLEAIRRLREEWVLRLRHRYLSLATCVPTVISGGQWVVSYPAHCRLDCHIEYLPEQADERGRGSRVAREFEEQGRARVRGLNLARRRSVAPPAPPARGVVALRCAAGGGFTRGAHPRGVARRGA